jgi:hypothetical protein
VEDGSSPREAVARFEVSASAAIKLVRRVRDTGSTEPAKIGAYRKSLLTGQEALLRELTSTRMRSYGQRRQADTEPGAARDGVPQAVRAAPAWRTTFVRHAQNQISTASGKPPRVMNLEPYQLRSDNLLAEQDLS